MGLSGQAAWIGTAASAIPLWMGASVFLAARFLRNPVRFCRRKDRSTTSFPDPMPELSHRYWEVGGGVKLHAATHGLGTGRPLLLFLHGFPELWYSWRHQMAEFKAEYEIVALDMRGYGGSDAPKGVASYHMGRLCADVAEVIRATGHTSCCLVAHDWGGAVAWVFAANYPQMVDRLAVLCSPHPAAYKDKKRFTAEQAKRSTYFLLFMARGLPEAWIRSRDFEALDDMLVKAPFGCRTAGAVTPEDLDRIKAALARPGALTAALNYYRAMIDNRTAHPSPEVQKAVDTQLTMPVLMLSADHDSAFCSSMFTDMERHAPHLTAAVLPDCSHFAQQDRPDLVNAHLRSFLQGSAGGGNSASIAKQASVLGRPRTGSITPASGPALALTASPRLPPPPSQQPSVRTV